jgi:hypothetical protein
VRGRLRCNRTDKTERRRVMFTNLCQLEIHHWVRICKMSVKKWLNHITKLHIVEALIVLSILISVASAIEHIDEL